MKINMNKDVETRDKIVFGKIINWSSHYGGGCESFEGLTGEQLEQLIEQGFADPEEIQNSSPTIKEFLKFLKANPKFTAIGYVVSPNRQDYRVSIEGIEFYGEYSKEELMNFSNIFHYADEFKAGKDHLRCWFD